jgi:PAS domain S-box-containing protein
MNEQRLKVLLVEDEPAYADLLQVLLAASSSFVLSHVSRLSQMLERLAQETFDVVLLDLSLPDGGGFQTYAEVHARAPSLPIIVLTGHDDEELALQAVREGAQDYLVKGQFDGKMLTRVIRYAIERKRAEEALRQREEFFRLISENVTDLIAVIDKDGQRLYNSPSYRKLLGDPQGLQGTSSFAEIHAEDRDRVRQLFRETLASGIGLKAEYRLTGQDGSVRHIESQGSVIRDERGRPCKVVVVSRDITERKAAVEVLRDALSDLKKSHEQLKAAQLRLIQAEKLEAVSTFAAGVAHEVKNPLQTIILGVDYLSNHVAAGDESASMVLNDMGEAVQRADGIIRGLLEFSAYNKRQVKEANLNAILEHSLRAVESELCNHPIVLVKELADDLPSLRLDVKTMKHVFINLFMYSIRGLAEGGKLIVRTYARPWPESPPGSGNAAAIFKAGDLVVTAEVEELRTSTAHEKPTEGGTTSMANKPARGGLGFAVLKKIIELYGGGVEFTSRKAGSKYTVMFKRHQPPSL